MTRDEKFYSLLDGVYDWTRERDAQAVSSAWRLSASDIEGARTELARLASAGSEISALYLGFTYLGFTSDQRDGQNEAASGGDNEQAEIWFRKAAAGGGGYALHALARHLHHCGRGPEAMPVYQAAWAAGHIESANFLGQMLIKGTVVPRDGRRGRAVLGSARRQGNASAEALLGLHLMRTEWYNPVSLVRGAWMYQRGGARLLRALRDENAKLSTRRGPLLGWLVLLALAVAAFAAIYWLPGYVADTAAWSRERQIPPFATFAFIAAIVFLIICGLWLADRAPKE